MGDREVARRRGNEAEQKWYGIVAQDGRSGAEAVQSGEGTEKKRSREGMERCEEGAVRTIYPRY